MKKYAVIVAGGLGTRMGAEVPKQFLLLKGRPLLYYTIRSFLLAYPDLLVILVLPAAHTEKGEEIIRSLNAAERVRIVYGGETRYHSVQKGLQHVTQPSIVFVHDGVRCLVSRQLIQQCYEQAVEKGSAIPAVAAVDSIRIMDGTAHQTINRNQVRIIQTPQTFQSSMLVEAFKQPYNPSFTDEATVAEAAGNEVFLIEGEYSNLKITRPADLCIAEQLLSETTF